MDYPFMKGFKYVNFFVLYVLTFIILDIKQVEFISFIILFVVNTITHIFLAVDLLNSPKQSDIIIFILLSGIILMFVAGIFLMIFVIKIMHFFKKNSLAINLDLLDTSDTQLRKIVDNTKIIYTTCAMLIGFVAFLFFISYRKSVAGNMESIFFEYFELDWNLTGISNVIQFIFIFFKGIFAMAILGLTAYLVYACNLLSRKGNYAYVESQIKQANSGKNKLDEITKDTQQKLFPNKVPPLQATNPFVQFFQNLNLNYISEYKVDTGLE
jgi:hypothetical protein